MQVIPTILENETQHFISQLKRLLPYFNHLQIDVGDGIFVPNKTIGANDVLTSIRQLDNEIIKGCVFDFHLMVVDYDKNIKIIQEIKKYVKVENILVHFGALKEDYTYDFGLVLDPKDDINTIASEYDLKKIPVVQIMTVNPGFQGSPFLPQTLNKIEQLRLLNYRNKILVDGGINDQTIPVILSQKYLPDTLCVGSFLTRAKDEELFKRIKQLKNY
jgi:ribulose-phosphate 3-epimerase